MDFDDTDDSRRCFYPQAEESPVLFDRRRPRNPAFSFRNYFGVFHGQHPEPYRRRAALLQRILKPETPATRTAHNLSTMVPYGRPRDPCRQRRLAIIRESKMLAGAGTR